MFLASYYLSYNKTDYHAGSASVKSTKLTDEIGLRLQFGHFDHDV